MKILNIADYYFPCEECKELAVTSIEIGGNSFELCSACFQKLINLLKEPIQE